MEERYRRLVKRQMQISRRRHRIIERSLLDIGIHSSQHFALMYLSDHSGAVSQVQLAELLNITPASVARTLKSLEAGGYIRSYWGDEQSGARRRYYAITPEGREKLARDTAAWQETRQVLDRLVGGESS